MAVVTSFLERICVKVMMDFSGCLQLRHTFELGGVAFSLSMLWAQIFPFVALLFFDGEKSAGVAKFLLISAVLWLLLNIVFFCMIDLSYVNTFFDTKMAPQYTVELYRTSEEEYNKFDAAFSNRSSYTKDIHGEVADWVRRNISRWRADKPEWFKIEMIPDDLLPDNVLEEEGGTRRRRSSNFGIR